MKSLGIVQFHDKKFNFLGFDGKWLSSLGNVPKPFSAIIYGDPGAGKTEMSVQFAKYLCRWDRVAWISYEQGHGADLQAATKRNNMQDVSGRFIPLDPIAKRKGSFFEELDAYLGKRNSPPFIFIDSVDYCRFTFDEFAHIKEKYSRKKSIVWISHAKGKDPKSALGKSIEYDAPIKIFVRKFIAYTRSRFGGLEDFIIYEPKARELNPLYFKNQTS